jgi:hypothetical protein
MGINTHIYTIWGIKTEWNDSFNDAYEEIEEQLVDEFGYGKPQPSNRQVNVIMDGMLCEYMIFGRILYDSGDMRYWDDMNNYQEIDLSSLVDEEKEYKETFKKLYPDHYHLVDKPFKLINVIHYS